MATLRAVTVLYIEIVVDPGPVVQRTRCRGVPVCPDPGWNTRRPFLSLAHLEPGVSAALVTEGEESVRLRTVCDDRMPPRRVDVCPTVCTGLRPGIALSGPGI